MTIFIFFSLSVNRQHTKLNQGYLRKSLEGLGRLTKVKKYGGVLFCVREGWWSDKLRIGTKADKTKS